MHVIIITSSSNRSGGTRQAIYQAHELAERGHTVTLCLPYNSSFWELPEALRNPAGKAQWLALPAEPREQRAAVEALFPTPDVPTIVHAFHNKSVKRVAWWGLFWRNRNLACVAHRGVIYRPGNPLPYLSPAMKAFIVNSHACAKAIGWHCPARKIHVVPNGIPDARVTPSRSRAEVSATLDIPDKTLTFAYVGNDNPAKGTELLLTAFARAAIADSRLLLIGTSERWKPLCDQLGIAGKVLHIGKTENVSDYLQICEAFVFPSRDMDSAPNTLLEAIRMGLPVVASTVGGVPEIVANNGILVPPGNVQAMTDALRVMAEQPEQRRIWAQNSLARGAQFTMCARCEALETIYQSVL